MNEKTEIKKPSFLRAIRSVLAAGVGIQSNKIREQDFNDGNLKMIIITGLIGVALFVSTLVLIVTFVIDQQ